MEIESILKKLVRAADTGYSNERTGYSNASGMHGAGAGRMAIKKQSLWVASRLIRPTVGPWDLPSTSLRSNLTASQSKG